MVTCSGKSLIPISIKAYQDFMNSVVPQAKLPEFTIKLDARQKVKSVFAKLDGTELTIYTGALVGLGISKFPEIGDSLDAHLMLFTIYGVKKAGLGQNFEIKSTDQGVDAVKTDPDFQMLSGQLGLFMNKFRPLNEAALSAPIQQVVEDQMQDESVISEDPIKEDSAVGAIQDNFEPVVETKKRSSNDSPYKGVPLENTPKIDVPDDLDLRTV